MLHYKHLLKICHILFWLLFFQFPFALRTDFSLANQFPISKYEIALNPEKRSLSGKAIFLLPPKKIYYIKLPQVKLEEISVKNSLHHLQELGKGDHKEALLNVYPLHSEGLVELRFTKEFSLKALFEGEYLLNPFPFISNHAFMYEVQINLSSSPKLKIFMPSDVFSRKEEEGGQKYRFTSKNPTKWLPPLIVGPFTQEDFSVSNLNLYLLFPPKLKNQAKHLSEELATKLDKLSFAYFSFKNLCLTFGLEEAISPGLITLSVKEPYAVPRVISLIWQHELTFGKEIPSPFLILGLSQYLGEYEFAKNKKDFRKTLLLSPNLKAYSFFKIYEIAQNMGEEIFKLNLMESLSNPHFEENFYKILKKLNLEELLKSEIINPSPRSFQVLLKTFPEENKKKGQLVISGKPFFGPIELELLLETEEGFLSHTVKLKGPEERISLELPTSFKSLRIDPEYKIYRTLNPEEIPRNLETFQASSFQILLPDRKYLPLYQPLLNLLRDLGGKLIEISASQSLPLDNPANLFVLHTPPGDYYLVPPKKGFYLKFLPHPKDPSKTIAFCRAHTLSDTENAFKELKKWWQAEEVFMIKGKIENLKLAKNIDGILIKEEAQFGIKPKKLTSFAELLSNLLSARIILIGEEHTKYEHHLFQLEILKEVYRYFPKVVVGLEMIQRPFQSLLDDFIAKKISEKEFLKKIEYFDRWGYDWNLYRDIFLWLQKNKVKALALDLPKELVKKILYKGLESLEDNEKFILPETDFHQSEIYYQYLKQIYLQHNMTTNATFKNFAQAQILREEAMAETLATFLQKNPEYRAIVLVGKGHIINRWGLYQALQRRIKSPIISIILGDLSELNPLIGDFLFNPQEANFPKSPQLGIILEEEKDGLKIKRIEKTSLAEKIGLQPQDLILSLNGERVKKINDLKLILTFLKKGDPLRIILKRETKILELQGKIE